MSGGTICGYNKGMTIQKDVDLSRYSTMRLGGKATALAEITSKNDLLEALAWAQKHNLPTLMLGGGSNVIFSNGYNGLVLLNRLHGFEVTSRSPQHVTLRIGAGEDWDSAVGRSVEMGLSGIEMLSLIPGTAGATPVQNVGAYGGEIADTFVELEAYDLHHNTFVTLQKVDCQFAYRTSVFKSLKDRRYIITSITLRLSTQPPRPPFYPALQTQLDRMRISSYTPQAVRDAVIAVRTSKLPDPKVLANTGSFFKNPIVSVEVMTRLLQSHPDMPHFTVDESRTKLSAGWLINAAGLAGHASHGMKIYEKNALVFVNDSAKSFKDLEAFRQEIIDGVHAAFGITLEQEPELI